MLDQDVSYSIQSEFDKAFPYLDELDDEISILKNAIEKKKLAEKSPVHKTKFSYLKFILFKIQKKEIVKINKPSQKLRFKTLKSHKYNKDGYLFYIRLIQKFDEEKIHYYEFSVNIIFNDLVKKEQFYKQINDINDAKQYYKDMEGVFKYLTRRDLMEKLFKMKRQEIENYKASLG